MAAQPDYKSHADVYSLMILASEPDSAHHSSPTPGAGDLLHHFSSLFELLDETVDLLDRSAAPRCDSHAALAIQNKMIVALLAGHRIDDRLNTHQFTLCFLGIRLPGDFLQARDHAEQFAERAHLTDRLELFAEILDRKFILLELTLEFLCLGLIVILLGLFDQAQHITHSENARRQAIGMKNLQRVQFLAESGEQDRRACNRSHREGRAAARVAVEFGQNHAGDLEPVMESLGNVHSVLARHRVGDEHRMMRLGGRLQPHKLVHQLLVDLKPSSSIYQEGVMAADIGAYQRAAH